MFLTDIQCFTSSEHLCVHPHCRQTMTAFLCYKFWQTSFWLSYYTAIYEMLISLDSKKRFALILHYSYSLSRHGTDPMTPWSMLWTIWLPTVAHGIFSQLVRLFRQARTAKPLVFGVGVVVRSQCAKNGNVTSTTI